MSPDNASMIEIRDLCVSYGNVPVVTDFTLTVRQETVVLFGPSGCGKSTILKAILGTKLPTMSRTGSVLINGKERETGKGDVRIVLQGPVVPNWIKVKDLCDLGARTRDSQGAYSRAEIDALLSAFGIIGLKDKYPNDLSGGQKQRVSLAVALLGKPKVLLMDEPTTFIDGATRIAIWNYFETVIQPLQIPRIIVSHDPVEAILLGDRIIVLSARAKVEDRIDVDLSHPRSETVEKSGRYWAYRKRLAM